MTTRKAALIECGQQPPTDVAPVYRPFLRFLVLALLLGTLLASVRILQIGLSRDMVTWAVLDADRVSDDQQFTRDGRYLIRVSRDRFIPSNDPVRAEVWATGHWERPIRTIPRVQRLCGSTRDGRRLLTLGIGATAKIWDTRTWKITQQIALDAVEAGESPAAALSPDGAWLASVSPKTSELTVRNTATWKVVTRLRPAYSVKGFSPDGSLLGYHAERKSGSRRLSFVRPTSGHHVFRVTADQMAFTPDGRYVAGEGGDGVVAVWDALSGKQVKRIDTGCWAPFGLSIARSGQLLGIANERGAKVFDFGTGRLLATCDTKEDYRHVALSPDGTLLVGAHHAGFEVWRLAPHSELSVRALFRRGGAR